MSPPSPPATSFWLLINNAPQGPYDLPTLQAKIAAGEINLQTLACPTGSNRWSPLSQFLSTGPTGAIPLSVSSARPSQSSQPQKDWLLPEATALPPITAPPLSDKKNGTNQRRSYIGFSIIFGLAPPIIGALVILGLHWLVGFIVNDWWGFEHQLRLARYCIVTATAGALIGAFFAFIVGFSEDRPSGISRWKTGVTTTTLALGIVALLCGASRWFFVWPSIVEKQPLQGHQGAITAIAISPDGNLVLSGSEDNTLRLWDMRFGKELKRFDGSSQPIACIAFSPDGELAVSGERGTPTLGPFGLSTALGDSTARLWRVRDGLELRRFSGHRGDITRVAFRSDGKEVVTAAGQTVCVWDTQTGEKLHLLEIKVPKSRLGSCLAVTGNGQFAVSSEHKRELLEPETLHIWDIASGRELGTLQGHSGWLQQLVVTPDEKRIIGIGTGSEFDIWDTSSQKLVKRDKLSGNCQFLAISPDGHRLLVGGGHRQKLKDEDEQEKKTDAKWTTYLCDLTTGDLLSLQEAPTSYEAMAVSLDGDHVLFGGGPDDRAIHLWEIGNEGWTSGFVVPVFVVLGAIIALVVVTSVYAALTEGTKKNT